MRARIILLSLLMTASGALAQNPSLSSAPLVTIGGPRDDRARVAQLLGQRASHGWLIRSSSADFRRTRNDSVSLLRRCTPDLTVLEPQLDLTWSSAIPFERNDGGVWAGRGLTTHLLAGLRVDCGALRIQIAPDLWFAQNKAFGFVGNLKPGRSGFAYPYFVDGLSADVPTRMGAKSLLVVDPGQSMLEIDAGPVTVGAATESEWWGPGIRNALVLSNHAAGIPRVYARPREPLRTRIGVLDARWFAGALMESPWFDFNPENDLRAASGAVVTLAIAADTNLSIGASRVVFSPISDLGSLHVRALDVFARWGTGVDVRDIAANGFAADQLASVFARWVFPESGFETYAELATVDLSSPSTGHTLGVQWVSSAVDPWRIHAELTNLEQRTPRREIAPPTFYGSPTVEQGFTNRGQVIGAMIGPGSSSQWVAVDRLKPRSSAGVFAGRVRWNNDAFYRSPNGRSVWAHDVSLFAGFRGLFDVAGVSLWAELVGEHRLNYQFQSSNGGYDTDDTFDVRNLTLRMALERQPRHRSTR